MRFSFLVGLFVVARAPLCTGDDLLAEFPLTSGLFDGEEWGKHNPEDPTGHTQVTFAHDTCLLHEPSQLSFDGTDHVILPSSHKNILNDKSAVSVGAWARSFSSGALFDKHVTVSLSFDYDNEYFICKIGTNDQEWWDPHAHVAMAQYGLKMEEWHHYAATFDGTTGHLSCYVDGVRLASTQIAGTSVRCCGNYAMWLGARKTLKDPWVGDVAYLRFYEMALTESAIQQWAYETGPTQKMCSSDAVSVPVASLALDPLSRITAGETLTLDATASRAGGAGQSIETFEWTIANGQSITNGDVTFSEIMPDAGVFPVELRVTNTDGHVSAPDVRYIVVEQDDTTDSSLVANYPLNAPILADISPNTHFDAIWKKFINNPGHTKAMFGELACHSSQPALVLDGTDAVELPKKIRDEFYGASALTVAIMAKVSTAGYIFYKAVSVLLAVGDNHEFICNVGTNDEWWDVPSFDYAGDLFDSWHHYAVTYDGSTVTCYLDGISVATKELSGVVYEDNHPVMLGAHSGSQNKMLAGELSSLKIYDRALSSSEVEDLADPLAACT